jgi:hypothetical protein
VTSFVFFWCRLCVYTWKDRCKYIHIRLICN